jgi:hypothetical protein
MLKIRPDEVPPEKAKISFRLPRPTIETLEKTYGVEPDRDFVVDKILTGFFASDREFALFRKNVCDRSDIKGADKGAPAAAKS